MSGGGARAQFRVAAPLVALGSFGLGGCTVYRVASVPVKVAATTVVVAGETAGAAVKATGKVATSAFNAAGRVGSSSLEASSQLAATGMVTFVDASTGAVVRIPWRRGMTLAAASADARLALAQRGLEIVRAGKVVYSAARLADAGAELASGDVVRLRQ